MEIVLTEGCICDSLVIDGKESSECTSEELLSVIRKILYKESSKFNLISFLDQVIDIFSDYASFVGDSCRYGRFLISFDENYDIIVNKLLTLYVLIYKRSYSSYVRFMLLF